MPRCSKCGKVNLENALFCQACGQRLEEPPPAAPAVSAHSLGGVELRTGEPPVCSRCRTVNTPGMSFCKMCGTPLPASSAPVATVPVVPSGSIKQTCPQCHQQTPAGFAFCQHCGTRLPNPASLREPTGPIPRGGDARSVSGAHRVEAKPAPRTDPIFAPTRGRLVALRPDGGDGQSHLLVGDRFDVGRSEGELTFGDDPGLAVRHARFTASGGVVRVRPLEATNGVYLQLRGPTDLAPGDRLLVGREVLRFEALAEGEDEASVIEHGVRLVGSLPRRSWGRLCQLTAAGTTRDVWHLARPEVVIGRDQGDVVFPDDEAVSPRHAVLRFASGRARIEDGGSDGGTFLRLRGEHELRHGDVVRLGDHRLRFES